MTAAASAASLLSGEVDADAAALFHQRATRGNFLRWVLLVAALYRANSSNATFQTAARDLTPGDLDRLYSAGAARDVLSAAVSGLGEVAALGSAERLSAHRQACLRTYQKGLYDEFVGQADGGTGRMDLLQSFDAGGLHPDSAVEGLFVSLSPRLGLRHSGVRQAHAAV